MATLALAAKGKAWRRAASSRALVSLQHPATRHPGFGALAIGTADTRGRRTYLTKRDARAADIENLAEEKQMRLFKGRLEDLVAATAAAGRENVRREESADLRAAGSSGAMSFALGGVQPEATDSEAGVGPFAAAAAESKRARKRLATAGLGEDDVRVALDAAIATLALHRESRVASMLGEGFYTIGPCGEEALGAVGLALRPSDPAALHYRHLATLLARHLRAGVPMGRALLDRARGYTCSALDPVSVCSPSLSLSLSRFLSPSLCSSVSSISPSLPVLYVCMRVRVYMRACVCVCVCRSREAFTAPWARARIPTVWTTA